MDSFKLYPRRHSEVPDIRIPEGNWKREWKPSIQRITNPETGIGTRNSIKETARDRMKEVKWELRKERSKKCEQNNVGAKQEDGYESRQCMEDLQEMVETGESNEYTYDKMCDVGIS